MRPVDRNTQGAVCFCLQKWTSVYFFTHMRGGGGVGLVMGLVAARYDYGWRGYGFVVGLVGGRPDRGVKC